MVSSSQDASRFHLWEATPLEYLERLHLQNLLVPGLNSLEGIIVHPDDEMALVASQPPFDIIPCHPAGGFLAFIAETLAAGHSLRTVRTVTTGK